MYKTVLKHNALYKMTNDDISINRKCDLRNVIARPVRLLVEQFCLVTRLDEPPGTANMNC